MTSVVAQTWLILRNDVRLQWRDLMAGKLRAVSSLGFLIFLLIALHLVSIMLFAVSRQPPTLLAETFVWLLFGFIMFGAAMNHAIAVLFERADFDLLLPSPVSSHAILLARWAGMTVGAAATVTMFLMPLLNGAAIGKSPRYLFGYVTWLLLASVVASAGVWATLLLVRLLGVQRARTWGQVLAVLLGTSIYFLFQAQNFLPEATRTALKARMGVLDHPAILFIAQSGRGHPWALLALAAVAAIFALITNRLLARLFISGVQEAGGVQTPTRRATRHVWVDGLGRATFWKDLRLIVRDPLLLSKVLPSALFLLPAVFALKGLAKAEVPALLAPFAVVATGMLSEQLALVATAGEEGWDLIRMSGASTVRMRIAKIAAAMAVPMLICATLVVVVAVLGRPGLAALTLAVTTVSSSAMCWVEVANIKPTPRKDLLQPGRYRRGISGVRVIIGSVFFVGSVASLVCAARGNWAWSAAATGGVGIAALMCFTLIAPRDPEMG